MDITTIRLKKETKKRLDSMKLTPGETYDDLLIRLTSILLKKREDKKNE